MAIPAAVGALLLSMIGAASGAASGMEARADVPLDELRVATTEVAAGLARPTAIAALKDGSGRLLITEKSGTVRGFHPDTGLEAEPVLDITDRVDESENERGLLGLAVAPDFGQSQAVYVAYTALPNGAVTLSRIRLDTGAEEVLLVQEHAEFGNHNGGHLMFGSDGHLYLGIGDGGGGGDPLENGQNLNTLLGKIVRIDVSATCGDLPYCVPADNPFVGVSGARAEIWSYGLRNPWRFSFDEADGSLWIADVGQGRFEEVDHIAGAQGGVNFGWSCMEGPNVFDEQRCEPDVEYTDPVFHYASGTEGCAVIGGFVYRGERFADLAGGTYVATDYCSATAWALRANADGTYTSGTIGAFPETVTAFGADEAGELYVVNDQPGRLFRVSFEHVPAV
ncbi:PQQ-dependent sugar dehydrogenase [Actinophytocola sp.]|uniref:PQQ-dependent sugar dehydrogenase n=1 Tax=Actinophytocola sp. TaxID=1872138 RepID=UPI003D6B9C05